MELWLPQSALQGEEENRSGISWTPTAANTAFATTYTWTDQSRTKSLVKPWLQPTYVQDWTTMLFWDGKVILLNTMLIEIPNWYYMETQASTSFKIKPETNTVMW